MKPILLSAIALTINVSSFAQNDSTAEIKKHTPNLATVHTIEGKTLKGWFYKLDDDLCYFIARGKQKKQLCQFNKS
jgi:hypothetical protein